MSSFPNILQPGDSGLDDFPEEAPAPVIFRPITPALTFAENFDAQSPADSVAITHIGTPITPRRRRGVLGAALLGVAAGAIGGLFVFEPSSPDQTASLPFQPPATAPAAIASIPQPTPTPTAQLNLPEAPAVASRVPSREASPARAVVATPPASQAPVLPAPASAPTAAKDIAAPAPTPSAPMPSAPPPLPTEQPAPLIAVAPAPPVAARAEVPTAEPPPPATTPTRVEAVRLEPAVAPVTTPKPADEQAAIDAAIGRYQAAYDNRDAAAVKRVWPSANQAALAKAFANLESQNLAFYGCRTTVDGSTARTSCEGQVSYVARVGDRSSRTQNRDWTFTLTRKSADDWQIEGVAIR